VLFFVKPGLFAPQLRGYLAYESHMGDLSALHTTRSRGDRGIVIGASDTRASLGLAFGPFRLIPGRGLLLEGEKPCRLGSRAMDILTALVERAGEAVSKQELLARVWPDTFVDDANLRVHVAALRKALGDGQAGARYIVNVMGRGYCFVAPVTRTDDAVPQDSLEPTHLRHNLPAPLTRVLGRNSAIEAIALQLPMRRCVSIVGPGGVGKTTVAVAVAEKLLPVYDNGAWFIDLASLTDRALIPFTMASALGFSVSSGNPVASLVAFLRDKRLLLLLDNCEHVADAIAPLTETLLRQAPNVHILTTSREALRAEGEWVYRLKPIEVPPRIDTLTAAQALQFPAVQLFVERAAASLDGYQLTDADAGAAAETCRRLDGLPLAIELIAARVDLFGVRGLAAMLNDHFLLVSEGPRTAQPRQQNMLGALSWSYCLLTSVEQTILRRLAVFRGDFTLDAAIAIVSGNGISVDEIYAAVLTLSTKSLITTDVTGQSQHHHHRLLNVTRAFVTQKLHESGEGELVNRLHAEYLCRLHAQAEADWEVMDRHAWLATYGRSIDDMRAALEWAFSSRGDLVIGLTLTAYAVPLGFQLAMIEELKIWVERALMHAGLVSPPQPLPEMRLNVTLGRLAHNIATPVPGQTFGFDRAVELSRQLPCLAHQTEPLIGLAAHQLNVANYASAAALVGKATDIAERSGDPKPVLAVNRIAAQVHHFNGDHAIADQLARKVLGHPIGQIPLAYNTMPVDRRVSMRVILARIAWLRGHPEQAMAIARESIDFAANDSPFSLCQALGLAAIPIALWTGDDAAAATMNETLVEQASRYTLAHWHGWAMAFQALLRMRSGAKGDPPRMSGGLQLETFATFSTDMLTPATVARADSGKAGWCRPEIHRVQGEWLLAQGAPGSMSAAEALFQRSLAAARQQEARAWELRAAMSLMRLRQRQGRSEEGRSLLANVVQQFAEGHTTSDLMAARLLLESMKLPARQAARRRVAAPLQANRSHR
jgi:predicted ATPase/DNA-binding winged helix-turn-helix (wHTH) protein